MHLQNYDEQQFASRFSQALEYYVRDGYKEDVNLSALVWRQLRIADIPRSEDIATQILRDYREQHREAYNNFSQARSVTHVIYKRMEAHRKIGEGISEALKTLNY